MHFSWTGWKRYRHGTESTFQINCSPRPSQKNLCHAKKQQLILQCFASKVKTITFTNGRTNGERNSVNKPKRGWRSLFFRFDLKIKRQQGTKLRVKKLEGHSLQEICRSENVIYSHCTDCKGLNPFHAKDVWQCKGRRHNNSDYTLIKAVISLW